MLRRTASLNSKFLVHLFPGKQFAANPLLQMAAENAFSLKGFCEAKGHDLVVTTTVEEFDKQLPTAEFVVTTPAWPVAITKERLASAKNLQVLLTAGIGSGHVDVAAAATQGISVLELTGSNAASYANHVVLMTLAALRDAPATGPVVTSALQSGSFDIARATTRAMDVQGRTVGVIGAGRVGYRVMTRLAAFDADIIYHDSHRLLRQLEVHANAAFSATPEELAAEADVIIVAVPTTRWTANLIDKTFLDAVKPGALLVNASSHEVVDFASLEEALNSGKLSGYATDCWPGSAPCANLAKLPNTSVWPPSGGLTLDAQATIARGVLDVADRFHTQRNFPAEYILAHNGLVVSKSLAAPQ